MTIAINARFLLTGHLEGFGWYTHELVRRIVLAHPEDHFVLFFDRPYDPVYQYADNVTAVVLPPKARFAPLFLTWFEWRVANALKKYRVEVFFSPDSMCSLRSKVPTVMTCHDLVPYHFPEQVPWIHRHFLRYFLPKYLRRADHILTVSDFVKQDILANFSIPESRITTVWNGCRAGFIPLNNADKQAVRDKFSDGNAYFFYAGAIHPRKNIPRLIRAFSLFKAQTHAPVKLLLAGRFAWQTGAVLTAFQQSDYQADIQFLGYVPEEDLKQLTAAAQALVYPSISEGFGLPMVEAMYCDTPVLAAQASCLPEIAGDAALLVDPYSEPALAAGLEQLWRDPELVETLIKNGRIQREKFSWDRAAEAVYGTFRNPSLF